MNVHLLCFTTILYFASTPVRIASQTHTKRSEQNEGKKGHVSAKTSVPTAEQILGKLLGMAQKPAEPAPVSAPAAAVPLLANQGQVLPAGPYSTSIARSPVTPGAQPQTIINSLPLIPAGSRQMPTPQTEENPGLPPPDPSTVYSAPPPSQGYQPPDFYPSYGRRQRKRPYADDGNDDDDDEGDSPPDDADDEENPADEEYDDRRGRGRGGGNRRLGRGGMGRGGMGRGGMGRGGIGGRGGVGGRNRQEGGCGSCNTCWRGIKPHVEWVRVPVCYHPCGICCPKHEEQGACPCICHPCHHNCCCHHCCPCHHCCRCCCRRDEIRWRLPLTPVPSRSKKFKRKHKTSKRNKKAIK